MTKRDEAYRSMVQKVLLLFKESQKIIKDNKPLNEAIVIIEQHLADITINEDVQRNVTVSLAKLKKESRLALNNSTFVIFGIIRTYALAIKDQKLYDEHDYSISKISKMNDTTMASFSTSTIVTINKYKEELLKHGLTQQLIEKYGREDDGYINYLAAPAEAKAKQRVATENISNLIKKIRTILDKEIDTYMVQYITTNLDFYRTYIFARIIYDNPTSHYALMGIVTDKQTKIPLQGVKVRFRAGTELIDTVKKTSKHGIYIFKKLPLEKCTVTFEKNYYQTITKNSEITDTKATNLNIELAKEEKETS